MRRLILSLLVTVASPLAAHELWIEPIEWRVGIDGNVSAALVNGQQFDGVNLAFFPNRIKSFDLHLGDDSTVVTGRIGDSPAMTMPTMGDGLHVAAYVSSVSTVTYTEWAKFISFAEHKDLGDVTAVRDVNGLPAEGFKEAYTRFSKSLIGVGSSEGSDRVLWLETELVALANPFTDDLSAGMPLQLWYQGEVRADEQIELFDRAPDGEVTVTLHRTDEDGIALVPVVAGHDYMADAVVLRLPEDDLAEATGAVWETLWANLTFHVPE
ncbi:DUF4198 domain-containing protein [Flavimaricola marinus]|uniref:Nickel uptake substrate-specific transmembrane region n=1 Tax=Flavimaricola marinus TaxID=1819565 RepID=A0A238LCS9_9RHOB|nr:DUF4198 domain-containing protein [Flavimaricola marinus]SMY07438.1 Nickel uptake substrate-specific transmembrane region [Flavimaricola marinus]